MASYLSQITLYVDEAGSDWLDGQWLDALIPLVSTETKVHVRIKNISGDSILFDHLAIWRKKGIEISYEPMNKNVRNLLEAIGCVDG